MSYAERLARAIEAVRHRCLECGCDRVSVIYLAALDDYIPDSGHWALGPGNCCPVLIGGIAAWQYHEDLWAALTDFDPSLGADYGAESWARAERRYS